MLSVKTIENKIITKLRDLPEEGKREVLEYIENLKNKKTEKTLELLKKTAGAWKGLVDAEKLKKDISSDRLISTRTRVKF